MLPAPSLLLLSVCLQTAQPTNNASQPNIIWLDRIENNYNCSTTCDIYYLHCTDATTAASRKPLLWSVTARGSAGLLIETKTLLQIFLQKQLSSANTKLQWFLKYQMLNDLLLTSNTTLTARQVWLSVFFIPTEVY